MSKGIIQMIKDKLKNRKANKQEKKEIIKKATKEGEEIFMKNRPDMAMSDKSYPKVSKDTPRKYNKEALRTQNQVIKTRLEQWKKNK